jgi:protein phosphatase
MEEILWNDPLISASGNKDWDYSKRGFGRLFGPNVSKKWLIMSETRVVVRGHQPCQGFKIDHDGMVMTLFSCKEPYPKFRAGHLVISAPQLLSMRTGMELSRYVS